MVKHNKFKKFWKIIENNYSYAGLITPLINIHDYWLMPLRWQVLQWYTQTENVLKYKY
jgi:hypothetical protein